MFEFISVTDNAGIATITLNREAKKNAFNDEMVQQLGSAVATVNRDDMTQCIVIKANGAIFSAGLDLEGANQENAADNLENNWKPVILSLVESEKPVIAQVAGPAIGFGAAVVLACDIVVMSEDAFFHLPFNDFGWVPDCGLTWMINQQVGAKTAFEIITSGKRLSGTEAESIGLVNRALNLEELDGYVQTIAGRLASLPPLAVQQTKRNLAFANANSIADTMSQEARSQGKLFQTEDAAEAMAAFIQKRKAVFKGR